MFNLTRGLVHEYTVEVRVKYNYLIKIYRGFEWQRLIFYFCLFFFTALYTSAPQSKTCNENQNTGPRMNRTRIWSMKGRELHLQYLSQMSLIHYKKSWMANSFLRNHVKDFIWTISRACMHISQLENLAKHSCCLNHKKK